MQEREGERSRLTVPPKPEEYYALGSGKDRTLQFESRFESGNLNLAYKMSDTEYKLITQNDVNTNGHTQCNSFLRLGFFFRVGNTTKGLTVKFNIINMVGPNHQFRASLTPFTIRGCECVCTHELRTEEKGAGGTEQGKTFSTSRITTRR